MDPYRLGTIAQLRADAEILIRANYFPSALSRLQQALKIVNEELGPGNKITLEVGALTALVAKWVYEYK
jgi:hypothetical protein